MAFPAVIATLTTQNVNSTSLPGPFEIGGAIYVILQNQAFTLSTWSLNAFKSTDGGNTWVQVGGDSDACLQNGLYTSIAVGSIIYTIVALPGVGATRNIQVIAFDTGTDTFSPGVDTTRTQGFGGDTNAFLCAGYRASDNSIVVCNIKTNASPTRTFYFVYSIGSATAGAQIPCGETGASPDDWDCCGVLPGNGFTHLYFTSNDGAGNFTIHTQTLSNGGGLGGVQDIDSALAATPGYASFSNGTTVSFAWAPFTGNLNPLCKVFTGASADPVALVEQDVTYTGSMQSTNALSVAIAAGSKYAFFAGDFGFSNDGYNVDSGSGYGPFVDLGDNDVSALQGAPLVSQLWGLVLYAGNTVGAYFIGIGSPPPPPTTGPAAKMTAGGGTFFPRFVNKTLLHAQIARVVGPVNQIRAYREFAPLSWLYDFPNGNDLCLSREWRLFNAIDPVALSCARKPECFTGEQGFRPWVEAPAGAVTFNPDKAISLPNPASIDVVVLSFRVPLGFDGILLAQYHAYVGSGVFLEGSGDIVWRVRVNGRHLRDMGNMQVTIGSPQMLSPVPGGLWLHSGNLVEYVVSAPNGSGNLPLPGQGNILAGLHGWFFPRV